LRAIHEKRYLVKKRANQLYDVDAGCVFSAARAGLILLSPAGGHFIATFRGPLR
jgi:hypothetical protein